MEIPKSKEKKSTRTGAKGKVLSNHIETPYVTKMNLRIVGEEECQVTNLRWWWPKLARRRGL